MFTPKKLFNLITNLTKNSSFCIAYSGGMDSHALLYAMAFLCREHSWKIRAVYIHHGLNSQASGWENHCKQICSDLRIPFQAKRLKLIIHPGDSIEAVARKARYTVFQKLLRQNEFLLTAHTQNDQVETFLLQLLRGTGVKGLSAMPAKKKLGENYLLRPLLGITRDSLKTYAEKNNLHWIEDHTNLKLRFNRNYLRHKVLPMLRCRWPKVFSVIARSAAHCAEAASLLDQLAQSDLQKIKEENDVLVIAPLLKLKPDGQRNVLRYWIHLHDLQFPQKKQLEQIQNNVLLASSDMNPLFSCSEIKIRRYNGRLYLLKNLSLHNATHVIPWNFSRPLTLSDNQNTLIAERKMSVGIKTTLHPNRITVRFRRGGERCQPAGRRETHALKKLMQEWKIPVWQRERIPLIYLDNILIAVVGYCIAEGFVVKNGEWGWDITIK